MSNRVLSRTAGVLVLVTVAFCSGYFCALALGGFKEVEGPRARIMRLRGESAFILFRPSLFDELFGPGWRRESLFFGLNRAVDSDGRQLNVSAWPTEPIARGTTMVVTSGDDWEDLVCTLYSLEARTYVRLKINLRTGSVDVDGPPTKWTREVVMNDLGRLVFF